MVILASLNHEREERRDKEVPYRTRDFFMNSQDSSDIKDFAYTLMNSNRHSMI